MQIGTRFPWLCLMLTLSLTASLCGGILLHSLKVGQLKQVQRELVLEKEKVRLWRTVAEGKNDEALKILKRLEGASTGRPNFKEDLYHICKQIKELIAENDIPGKFMEFEKKRKEIEKRLQKELDKLPKE